MTGRHLSRVGAGTAVALWIAMASAGCTMAGTPVEPDSAAGNPSTVAAAEAACIDQTNALRATVGAPALVRSGSIDTFSTTAAQVDGEAHEAHKYFLETNGGDGVALAENVIPWWKVSDWGSIQNIVKTGVNQMWQEGPGGHHYVNMTGQYTQMGCGIAVINGEVTVSQNFH